MTEPTWNETIPAARSIARRTDIPLHGTVENPGRRELFEMCGLIAPDGSIPPDDTATYALVDPGGSPGAKDPDAINPRAFVEHGRRPEGMTTPDGLATLQPKWTNGPRVEMSTSQRYYGEGYERGDWPAIYGSIRLLQTALPHCRIYYGGDTDDTAPEVTEESLAETWAHFLGPHGDDYRREVRLWNQAHR